MPQHQVYLGDGIYASHDGWNIWLEAERDGMRHRIAIEPDVLASLNNYATSLRQPAPAPTPEPAEENAGSGEDFMHVLSFGVEPPEKPDCQPSNPDECPACKGGPCVGEPT